MNESPPPGLTHPADRETWFGWRAAGFFFRWVDGDKFLAVLTDAKASRVVDAIPFPSNVSDPRADIRRLAANWAHDHAQARRAP